MDPCPTLVLIMVFAETSGAAFPVTSHSVRLAEHPGVSCKKTPKTSVGYSKLKQTSGNRKQGWTGSSNRPWRRGL